MRKIVLFGLGLSLTAAGLAGCGDPGDGSTAGEENTGAPSGVAVQTPDGASSARTGASSANQARRGSANSTVDEAIDGKYNPGFDLDEDLQAAINGPRAINTFAGTLPPQDGTISGTTFSTGAGALTGTVSFTGMLDDAGETPADAITGVFMYVNTGGTAPNCGGSGNAGLDVTAGLPGDFVALTGAGSYTMALSEGQQYSIRLCAVDATPTGAVTGVTTSFTTPSRPTDGTATASVTGTGPFGASVAVSGYSDDVAVSGYILRVNTGGTAPTAGCAVAGNAGLDQGSIGAPAAAPFTLSGLTQGGTYSVRVCAVDAASLVSAGDADTVVIPALPADGTILRAVVTGSTPTFATVLSLSGLTDVDGTVAGVRVRVNSGTTAPAAGCAVAGDAGVDIGTTTAPTGFSGGAGTITLASTLSTNTYSARVCAVDNAGLVADGSTLTFYAPQVAPAAGAIVGATVSGSGPYSVALSLSGFTDNNNGTPAQTMSSALIRVDTSASVPAAGCGSAGTYNSGGSDQGTADAPTAITGYNSTTGVGTMTVTGLAAGTYNIRVCGRDADDRIVGSGATVVVTAPTTALPSNGNVVGFLPGGSDRYPVTTSSLYTAYLNLDNFAVTPIAGLRVRVNTDSTQPAAGCGSAGNFNSGGSDLGALGTSGIAPSSFNLSTGEGSIAITGLTIPTGTSRVYTVRVCGVDAENTTVTGNGVVYTLTMRTDTQKPANGTIDLSKITSSGTTPSVIATIPLTSGFTDDREVHHFVVRVNTGVVLPALGCGANGTYSSGAVDRDDTNTSTVTTDDDVVLASAVGIVAGVPYAGPAADGAGTTFTIPGLAATAAGTQYRIRVCAVDFAGNTADGVDALFTAKSGGATQPTAPTFVVTPASGDVASGGYYSSRSVTLDTGALSGTKICISNNPLTSAGTSALVEGACGTGWKALSGAGEIATALVAGTHPWTLSAGDGVKTVYMKTHDANNNESAVATATLNIDSVAPARNGITVKSDSANYSDNGDSGFRTNLVSWTPFFEAGSGVDSYKLVYSSNGTVPPTDCATSATVFEIDDWMDSTSLDEGVAPTGAAPYAHEFEYSNTTGVTATRLTAGLLYIYRVCATDLYGRTSSDTTPGATSRAVAAGDYTGPTWPVSPATFTLQDGDGVSASGNWTDSIAYVDAVPNAAMTSNIQVGDEWCFSTSANASSCTPAMWKSTTLVDLDGSGAGTTLGVKTAVTLTSADGIKTVYVHSRDLYRNVSATPSTISATITLDRTKVPSPASFAATSNTAGTTVTLTWTSMATAEVAVTPSLSPVVAGKSGYSRLRIVRRASVAPTNCGVSGGGTEVFDSLNGGAQTITATTVADTGRTTKTKYVYLVCAYDLAGMSGENHNSGKAVTVTTK